MLPVDIEEIDQLFRKVDFSKDNPGSEARMWQRITEYMSWGEQEEQVLDDDDMDMLAAAGETSYPLEAMFRETDQDDKEKKS